jgi:hypothetical protein
MGRARSTNGEKSNAFMILVGKPEGIRPPRRRWVDNIKIDLREIMNRIMNRTMTTLKVASISPAEHKSTVHKLRIVTLGSRTVPVPELPTAYND